MLHGCVSVLPTFVAETDFDGALINVAIQIRLTNMHIEMTKRVFDERRVVGGKRFATTEINVGDSFCTLPHRIVNMVMRKAKDAKLEG